MQLKFYFLASQDTTLKWHGHCTMRYDLKKSVNRKIYQKNLPRPSFFLGCIISDEKYLKRMFDQFHFHYTFGLEMTAQE